MGPRRKYLVRNQQSSKNMILTAFSFYDPSILSQNSSLSVVIQLT